MSFVLRIFISGLIVLTPQDGGGYTASLLPSPPDCKHLPTLAVSGECRMGSGGSPGANCPVLSYGDCTDVDGAWRLADGKIELGPILTQRSTIRREGGRNWCFLWGNRQVPCRRWAADDADWALQLEELGTGAPAKLKAMQQSGIRMQLPPGTLSTASLLTAPLERYVTSIQFKDDGKRVVHEQAAAEVMLLETQVEAEELVLRVPTGPGTYQTVALKPQENGGVHYIELYLSNEADAEDCKGVHHHLGAYLEETGGDGDLMVEIDCDNRRKFDQLKDGLTTPKLSKCLPSFTVWSKKSNPELWAELSDFLSKHFCEDEDCRSQVSKVVCKLAVALPAACANFTSSNGATAWTNDPEFAALARELGEGPTRTLDLKAILKQICTRVPGGGTGGKPICPVAEVQ